MKTTVIAYWIIVLALLGAAGGNGVAGAERASELAPLQRDLGRLASLQNRFEALSRQLDDVPTAGRDYDEYKNVWLATVAAITAASDICEYESDQLALFLDLKPQRRRHYLDIRSESLRNSIGQVRLMQQQIDISGKLFPPTWRDDALIGQGRALMSQLIDLLEDCHALIGAMKPRG